jgi:putative DNA methylase
VEAGGRLIQEPAIPNLQNSTDVTYYDNVPYADLSDFFYINLRRWIGDIYPELFTTLLVPKADELVADQQRHGGKANAKNFFEAGLASVFERLRGIQAADFPLSIFYAFKQSETTSEEKSDGFGSAVSTGWESMLQGLVGAAFQIVSTWPIRTEQPGGLRQSGRNALASSIVLVCRNRNDDAPMATRNEFVRLLRRELPPALLQLQQGNIAPVDLAQAAIGPGMGIYTRFAEVREPDGKSLSIRSALSLINQVLDEILSDQDVDYDADTRLAIAWFETHGMSEGPFGDAETLAKAKLTSVEALEQAGILLAAKNRARLLSRGELQANWDPATDPRLTVWEITQHLIRALESGGQAAAAAIVRGAGPLAEAARDLAYRLYAVCERKGWSAEAQAYNSLVVAWPELIRLAADAPAATGERQENLL